jgi:hypothetical protein
MKHITVSHFSRFMFGVLLATAMVGCETAKSGPKPSSATPTPSPVADRPTIRIKAGAEQPLKDSKGVVWAADTGFEGGTTIDRPDLKVTGTDIPEIYCSERYLMDSYSIKVPNGNYLLKLHFSEDYEGIADASGRIFNYTVKDGDAAGGKVIKEVKGFGPWKASGAAFKAYIDSVPMTVTNGKITIVFTPEVENPQINAIEVLPQ